MLMMHHHQERQKQGSFLKRLGQKTSHTFPGKNMVDERMQDAYILNGGSEFSLAVIFQ